MIHSHPTSEEGEQMVIGQWEWKVRKLSSGSPSFFFLSEISSEVISWEEGAGKDTLNPVVLESGKVS